MLCYIIAAYVSQRMDDYSFDKNADETAELLSEESFSEAVSNILRLSRVGAVLPFVCRFGNKDQIKAAIQKYETSDDKKRMLAALVLSDTSSSVAFKYSNDLTIKGFSVEYGNAPMGKVYIQKLQPDKWGRRTNLIIGILDRIALYPQIRNDSLTSDSLDGFTLYQIMRLIELAVSEKSLDSMIVLLNDKHEHFGDLFPMKDFILKL